MIIRDATYEVRGIFDMAIMTEEEKFVVGKCVMCGGKLERAALGYICNQCRDGMRTKK